jgi:2OG-Fe(II) oxygenase superfamily
LLASRSLLRTAHYSCAGKWLEVPIRRDAFVVNLGDMFQLWSNGKFRSTLHRVVSLHPKLQAPQAESFSSVLASLVPELQDIAWNRVRVSYSLKLAAFKNGFGHGIS